uniref:Uncharacterized protein n=2 Tax=Clytia hemisphaerica TaxID=252671 RepID=A0A7M5V5V6_9CNID
MVASLKGKFGALVVGSKLSSDEMKGHGNGWLSVATNIPEKKWEKKKSTKKLLKVNNKNNSGIISSFSSSPFFHENISFLDTSNYRQTSISSFLKKKSKAKEKGKKHVYPGKENIPPNLNTDVQLKEDDSYISDNELSIPVVSLRNSQNMKSFDTKLLQFHSSDESSDESPTAVNNHEPSLRKNIDFAENTFLREMHEESCHTNLDPLFSCNDESEITDANDKSIPANIRITPEFGVKETNRCKASFESRLKEITQSEDSPQDFNSEDLFSKSSKSMSAENPKIKNCDHKLFEEESLCPDLQNRPKQSFLDPFTDLQASNDLEENIEIKNHGSRSNFLKQLHEKSFTNLEPFNEESQQIEKLHEFTPITNEIKLNINDKKEKDFLKKLHEQNMFSNLDLFGETQEETQDSVNSNIPKTTYESGKSNEKSTVLMKLHEESCLTNLDPFLSEENNDVFACNKTEGSLIIGDKPPPPINFSNTLEESYFNSHTSSTSSELQSQCICNFKRQLQSDGSSQWESSKSVAKNVVGFDDFWDL